MQDKNRKILPICVALTVQQGGDAVVVWGCITYAEAGEFEVDSGGKYCEKVEEVLIHSAQMLLE